MLRENPFSHFRFAKGPETLREHSRGEFETQVPVFVVLLGQQHNCLFCHKAEDARPPVREAPWPSLGLVVIEVWHKRQWQKVGRHLETRGCRILKP